MNIPGIILRQTDSGRVTMTPRVTSRANFSSAISIILCISIARYRANLQALKYYYGKRYVGVVKKCCDTATFFSTTPYAAIPHFGILLWKAV
jgi:hypothetical protein